MKAKDVIKKSSVFEGLHPEEKPVSDDTQTDKHDDVSEHKHDDVSTDNHTHTHKHKDTPKPKVRERKTFRAQILTYPSLIERMDEYAALNDMSRAEVFEQAVTEFLKRKS